MLNNYYTHIAIVLFSLYQLRLSYLEWMDIQLEEDPVSFEFKLHIYGTLLTYICLFLFSSIMIYSIYYNKKIYEWKPILPENPKPSGGGCGLKHNNTKKAIRAGGRKFRKFRQNLGLKNFTSKN